MECVALTDEWKFYQQETDTDDSDINMMGDNTSVITHSWTIGEKYDVTVIDDPENGKFNISFDSDKGRVEGLNVLSANKDLFKHVFGIDISYCIDHAIEWQHNNLLE